jgi:hypothetical protein
MISSGSSFGAVDDDVLVQVEPDEPLEGLSVRLLEHEHADGLLMAQVEVVRNLLHKGRLTDP